MIKPLAPIALFLYQSVSAADPIAVAPNVTGGHTVLTNEDCKMMPQHLQAYATNERGSVSHACWYLEGDFIYFLPKSGILRRMPLDQFEVTPPPVNQPKPKKLSKINV